MNPNPPPSLDITTEALADLAPFLEAIRKSPSDPGPAAVLSDWLEEQGFVLASGTARLLAEAAQAQPNHPQRALLIRRAHFALGWLAKLGPHSQTVAATLEEMANAIYDPLPIPEPPVAPAEILRFRRIGLLTRAWLAARNRLALVPSSRVPPHLWTTAIQAGQLDHLQALIIVAPDPAIALRVLGPALSLPRLGHLTIKLNDMFNSELSAAIDSRPIPNAQPLGFDLSERLARAIAVVGPEPIRQEFMVPPVSDPQPSAGSRSWWRRSRRDEPQPNLQEESRFVAARHHWRDQVLRLIRESYWSEVPQLPHRSSKDLAQSADLHLELSGLIVSLPLAEALAAWPGLSRVVSLKLSQCHLVDDNAALTLLNSKFLDQLVQLDMTFTPLSERVWTGLTRLGLECVIVSGGLPEEYRVTATVFGPRLLSRDALILPGGRVVRGKKEDVGRSKDWNP